MADECDFGVIGLAVMGENLILNIESRGYTVAVHNRTTAKIDEFVAGRAAGKKIVGCPTVADMAKALKRPRKAMIMVKAGPAVDAVIHQLTEVFEPGDIIIDGGNSFYTDTMRREKELSDKGFLFMGTGVSGGEEGALLGPSLMPGGTAEAWPHVKELMQAIAAKVGPNNDIPCCEWVGPDGAGHYVKMVHNGIEYGDMQLICEAYHLLKDACGLSNEELHDTFNAWNQTELDSYLIEITRDVFTVKDDETGKYMVDVILDKAGQKGTGKWMSQHALDLGVPTTLITEAVFARCLSAQKDARVRASKVLHGPSDEMKKFQDSVDKEAFKEDIRKALYASKIVSYAQGFVQLEYAAKEFGWDLHYGEIAMLWRGGCIIRAQFLERIKDAFDRNPTLENLMLDDYFRDALESGQKAWRNVVSTAAQIGIPIPEFGAALSYYDGYRNARLPANLLQAQRDYFGAHTYERVDKEGVFHTDWIHLRKSN